MLNRFIFFAFFFNSFPVFTQVKTIATPTTAATWWNLSHPNEIRPITVKPSFTLKSEITSNGKYLLGVNIFAFDRIHNDIPYGKIRHETEIYIFSFNPDNGFDSIPLYGDDLKLLKAQIPLSSDYFNCSPRYIIKFSKEGYRRVVLYVNVYFDSHIRDSIYRAEGEYVFRAELNINMKPLKSKESNKPDTLGVLSWDNKTKTFKLKEIPRCPALKKEIAIQQGEKITLENIFFETGSSVLLSSSYNEIDKLLDFLQQNKKMNIEISGHTDNKGDETKNKELSKNRAKAVADYLASNGVSQTRISFLGYGSSKPIATNDTDAGRKQNRRVEFFIK